MSAERRVLTPLSLVRLPRGIPEHGIPAGAIATILDVYEKPSLAYEIEVSDGDGHSLFVGVILASEVEPCVPDRSG